MGLRIICEIGTILRLRQKLELSENTFAELKLDLRIFVSEERREKELDS